MEQKGEEISGLKQMIKELREIDTNEELLFGRADNYKLYRTIFEGKEIEDFKNIVLNTIDFYLESRSIEKYDLEISCDDSIEVVETKFVNEYEKLIENVNNEEDINSIDKETNSLFKFKDMYCKLIDNNSEKISKCEFIDNPEAFIEKCKNNRSFCQENI